MLLIIVAGILEGIRLSVGKFGMSLGLGPRERWFDSSQTECGCGVMAAYKTVILGEWVQFPSVTYLKWILNGRTNQ